MRLVNKYLMQAIEEQRLAISDQQLADEQNLEIFIPGSDERCAMVPLKP